MDYNFPVVREKIFCKDGTYVGKEAIRRQDNGNVLGVVSESYNLLKHSKAIESAEKVMSNIGKWTQDKIQITCNGGRMYVEYKFDDKEVSIGKTKDKDGLEIDDIVHPRLILTNSYNGSLEFGFMIGAWRSVCSNGLRIGTDIFKIRSKHTSGMDINNVAEQAQKASKMFFDRIVPRYKELNSEMVTDICGFMEQLKEKKVPTRLVDKITNEICEKEESKWDIYNRFTKFLTHEYGKSYDRKEMLQKVVAKGFGI